MLRKRQSGEDPDVHLTADSAKELLPLLLGIGFSVGVFSGFFGIAGGFLIVPGLILATGRPLTSAVGTSLVATRPLVPQQPPAALGQVWSTGRSQRSLYLAGSRPTLSACGPVGSWPKASALSVSFLRVSLSPSG